MPPPKAPAENITFLFTDIVGSTEMWERLGDAFLPILQAHNAILSDSVTRYGGHLFKTEGDAYKVAFTDPTSAVKCAILAQAALQRYPWPPEIGALRVRMAMHTGKPFVQGGDYFGPPVNRAARVLSTTHGDQILLSDETLHLVEHHMEAGTRFADQGYHRLKDLEEPIRLYDVRHPALESRAFPPPRSLNGHANNLPTQRRSFIGREKQIEQIATAFAKGDNRLLTLTGPQGSGKTRLAMQASAEYIHLFPDGVWLVRLTHATDVVGAAIEVADTMGIPLPPGAHPLETVRQYLALRSCLLILDDVGNLAHADRLIRELLSETETLRCLATSTQPFQMEHGMEIPLPELSRPPENPTPADLMASEAGRLFVERAQENRPDFTVTPQRAKGIGRLLAKLEMAMPAPIQNLAGMMKTVSVDAMGQALDRGREATRSVQQTPELAALWQSIANTVVKLNPAEAERKLRDALAICQQYGDQSGMANALHRLGNLAYERKEFSRAILLLNAAHKIFTEIESPEQLATRTALEHAYRAQGQHQPHADTPLETAIFHAMNVPELPEAS